MSKSKQPYRDTKVMPSLGEIQRNDKGHKCIWHACVDCGKERWVALIRGEPENLRCHSCANRNRRLKDGRIQDKAGYVLVKLQPDDFFYPMARHSGYVLEHRLTMAKHLKRCLLPWELVHHRDEVKSHNDISNLELLPTQYSHLSLTRMAKRIKKLEIQNDSLKQQIKLLQFRTAWVERGSLQGFVRPRRVKR